MRPWYLSFVLLLSGCTEQLSSGLPDLRLQLDDVSAQGICCWRGSGDPREPHLRLELEQPHCTPPEVPVRRRQCDSVCCLTPGGVSLPTMWGVCEARGGRGRGEACQPAGLMCCQGADGYRLLPSCGGPQDVLLCDQICCMDDQAVGWMTEGSCLPGGTWVDPRRCMEGAQDMATGN